MKFLLLFWFFGGVRLNGSSCEKEIMCKNKCHFRSFFQCRCRERGQNNKTHLVGQGGKKIFMCGRDLFIVSYSQSKSCIKTVFPAGHTKTLKRSSIWLSKQIKRIYFFAAISAPNKNNPSATPLERPWPSGKLFFFLASSGFNYVFGGIERGSLLLLLLPPSMMKTVSHQQVRRFLRVFLFFPSFFWPMPYGKPVKGIYRCHRLPSVLTTTH